MQGRASVLLLTRVVLSMSIITSSRGRWRLTFFGAQICCLLYRKGDGSWPRKREEAVRRGAVRAAGRSALGSWRTGREVPSSGGSFHSQARIILSGAGRGCLWERTGSRATFPCVRPLGLFLFTPVLISLLNRPSCQIFTFAFAADRSCGLCCYWSILLSNVAEISGWKNPYCPIVFLLLWHIKLVKKKKGFDYTRSFKKIVVFLS